MEMFTRLFFLSIYFFFFQLYFLLNYYNNSFTFRSSGSVHINLRANRFHCVLCMQCVSNVFKCFYSFLFVVRWATHIDTVVGWASWLAGMTDDTIQFGVLKYYKTPKHHSHQFIFYTCCIGVYCVYVLYVNSQFALWQLNMHAIIINNIISI